jgi:hypothetical protein
LPRRRGRPTAGRRWDTPCHNLNARYDTLSALDSHTQGTHPSDAFKNPTPVASRLGPAPRRTRLPRSCGASSAPPGAARASRCWTSAFARAPAAGPLARPPGVGSHPGCRGATGGCRDCRCCCCLGARPAASSDAVDSTSPPLTLLSRDGLGLPPRAPLPPPRAASRSPRSLPLLRATRQLAPLKPTGYVCPVWHSE